MRRLALVLAVALCGCQQITGVQHTHGCPRVREYHFTFTLDSIPDTLRIEQPKCVAH